MDAVKARGDSLVRWRYLLTDQLYWRKFVLDLFVRGVIHPPIVGNRSEHGESDKDAKSVWGSYMCSATK